MLVKFQHTCYCCGEQFTISSEFSLHIHNTIIIFETYVLQLFFREIDISTILYTSYQMQSCFLANHKRNLHIKNTIIYLCIKQSCILAIHKRNIRKKIPSSIFVNNKITCYCCGEQFTISSEFSLHKRNLHIKNTIIYLCIKQFSLY